jgi:hypothetical protein
MKEKRNIFIIVFYSISTLLDYPAFSQDLLLTPQIPVQQIPFNSEKTEKNKTTSIEDYGTQKSYLKSTQSNNLIYDWGRRLSTEYNDRYYDVIIDVSGNVIVGGSKGISSSDLDAVIFKNDNNGNSIWNYIPAQSSGHDAIYGIATDEKSNIYVTGKFNSTAFNGRISSKGNADIFMAKYDPSGNVVWAKSAGGNLNDYGCKIELDALGNIYLVGYFNGTAYWDNIVKTSSTEGDMFIAKYNNDGNALWVRTGNIGENSYLHGIGVDKLGNSYVSANFSDTMKFEGASTISSKGGDDMFLIKYDSYGNFQWQKTVGGAGDDGGNDTEVDNEGNILVCGYFSNEANFENKTLTAHGSFDIFCAKYSPDGNMIWVKQFGGTGSQTAWSIASDEKSNCYITGWFSGTGAFDNTTIVSSGGSDTYAIKYDKYGNLIWVEHIAKGAEKQVGSGIFARENDMVISGYYEGEMTIFNSNYDNSGGEDAYRAKFIQQSNNQPVIYVNPSLSISTSQVKQNQSIIFSGVQFSPVGKIDLLFSGSGILSPVIDIPIGVNGSFQYTLTINSNQSVGDYSITAVDKITGKTITRNFQIISNQEIVHDYFNITAPSVPESKTVNDPIIISWNDKANSTYNFRHNYSVQYQKDNGVWHTIHTFEGENNGYGFIKGNVEFKPSISGLYKFKVTDNNNNARSKTSPLITVSNAATPDIKIEYRWDRSYEKPLTINNPVGVAADGVGRFYIVVSNTNSLNSGIQKIKVTLSDPDGYTATQFLGKVKYCTTQNDNDFAMDGNTAIFIEAENLSSNVDGKYWFWYVAPEDFARNEGDWDETERSITATFQITLINGNQLSPIKKEIKIVRPPLMLVHGLTGDHQTWDNFPNAAGEPFITDDRFINVTRAVDMLPTSAFNENSSLLLDDENTLLKNSFIALIREVREEGYACNQVDYVCHSMGGSIFRNTVTYFNSSYKGKYNYNKGYAHKFISLHTPHQGSSYANFLYSIDYEGNWLIQWAFDKKAGLFSCRALRCSLENAVKDLRYKDGVKFNEQNVPSHLIGSGTTCSDYPKETKDKLIDIAFLLNDYNIIHPVTICYSLDNYFTTNGLESDFIENNDGIVSFESQFSGYKINSLPKNCTFIPGFMHNSDFGESPTSSYEVGKKVDELLNSNVNSELFGILPSTFPTKSKSEEKQNQQLISIITNKIQILHPENNAEYNAGDTITIKANIDTLGLQNFGLIFQKQVIFENPVKPDIEFKLVVNQDEIENQEIIIIGNYIESDSLKQSYTKINVKVNPVGSIVDFSVKPEVILIEKGKSRRPKYEAVFPNAISFVGTTNLIAVSIANPLIVGYDTETNEFIGLEAGSTSAVITYRGKSKQVFLEIIEFETPPVNPVTGIDDTELYRSDDNSNIKTYPNPFSKEITFDFTATKESDFILEITNMYGQNMKTYIFENQPVGLNSKTVDLSDLSDGIYLYRLLSENNYHVGKIIKKKNN